MYPTKQSILLCETLGALCSQFSHGKFASLSAKPANAMEVDGQSQLNPFQQLLPQLLRKLETIVDTSGFDKDQVQFVEILSAVCLQSMLGCFMPHRVLDIFQKVFKVTTQWTQYRIARSASR